MSEPTINEIKRQFSDALQIIAKLKEENEGLLADLDFAYKNLRKLNAIIDVAPHTRWCELSLTDGECDCWKSEVLEIDE